MVTHRTQSEIRTLISKIKGNTEGVDEYQKGFLFRLESELNNSIQNERNLLERTSEYREGIQDAERWLQDDTLTVEFDDYAE